MTAEEAKGILNLMWVRTTNQHECDAITVAEMALEKQIPMKPLHRHKNYYCPICKGDGWVMWDDALPTKFDNYCGQCGQRLDWSEVEG